MKILVVVVIIIAIGFPRKSWAQMSSMADTTKSVYGDLPIIKTYGVSSSACFCGDSSWFKINDNYVDESTYRKFGETIENYSKCKPCVMLRFDISENLINKWIAYSECRVGYWIEYYKNGKVKAIGHFKENESGDWNNLVARGYCKEDGVWTFFNTKGVVIRTEIWKEGKLVKKVIAKKK
ncbi:MAG: hypothetical protein EOO46_25035 [Flavobacterium sp.]|nr:MAG: hypothetical protein EOO46_25035 [Flavobacterium sp.]